MQKTIFDGTLLAEVLAYTGEMKPVTESKSKLFSEKVVGEMTQLEKTIHALYHAKLKEHDLMLKSISDGIKSEGKLDVETILKEASKEQIATIEKSLIEVNCLRTLLFNLMRLRFPESNGITIGIRPGHTIVIGMNEQDMMEMFGFEKVVEIIFM